MLMNENGFNSYQNNQLEAKAASASPTELIVMLIDGFNDNLIKAKGHMANKRIYEKGMYLHDEGRGCYETPKPWLVISKAKVLRFLERQCFMTTRSFRH